MFLSLENINILNRVVQPLLTAGVKKIWCELHLNSIDARLRYRKIRSFSSRGMDLPHALVVYRSRMGKLKGNKCLRIAFGPEGVADPSWLWSALGSPPASVSARWGVRAAHTVVRLGLRKWLYLETHSQGLRAKILNVPVSVEM